MKAGDNPDGYRLLRLIGRGGFGEVWLCRSESMGDYRALKFIACGSTGLMEKEHRALVQYRRVAAQLRSPHLMPIEHVNRNESGMYYVMPLADGCGAACPEDSGWFPLTVAAMLRERAGAAMWLDSREITSVLGPVLLALQCLSDAGLVHRDVKPENILFLGGHACLADISLLDQDAAALTHRGTPGYATPSWYREGHTDMFGVAATLYTMLTGNAPDKMGRAAFLWPPQGEASLTESERARWKQLHTVIRRATEENPGERYRDFTDMADALAGGTNGQTGQISRRRWLAGAGGGVSLLLAASMISGVWQRAAKPPAVQPVEPSVEPPAKLLTKKPEDSLTPYERADYIALASMAKNYLDDGKFAHALESVDMLLNTYPQSHTQAAYSLIRASALHGLERDKEALKELEKEIHIDPNLMAINVRCDLWEEMGDLEAAERNLNLVIERYHAITLHYYKRAEIRAKLGDFAGVYADKLEALKLPPQEPVRKKVVDTLWGPFETKYEGYRDFIRGLGNNG